MDGISVLRLIFAVSGFEAKDLVAILYFALQLAGM
jgi:hypothetical protein